MNYGIDHPVIKVRVISLNYPQVVFWPGNNGFYVELECLVAVSDGRNRSVITRGCNVCLNARLSVGIKGNVLKNQKETYAEAYYKKETAHRLESHYLK